LVCGCVSMAAAWCDFPAGYAALSVTESDAFKCDPTSLGNCRRDSTMVSEIAATVGLRVGNAGGLIRAAGRRRQTEAAKSPPRFHAEADFGSQPANYCFSGVAGGVAPGKMPSIGLRRCSSSTGLGSGLRGIIWSRIAAL